jgi:hypothetical protein
MKQIEIPTDFDPDVYLELHADVKKAGIDPIQHYLEFGIKEGRAYKKINDLENSLATFLTLSPINKNAFDLFSRTWSTKFDDMTKGSFDGTRDNRIDWLLQQVDVASFNILELGPLEAAHTVMLEKSIKGGGIVAIESNIGAFLRCLIVKNYLNLQAKFILGDFEKMDFSTQNYDLIMASGILYHLKQPVDFIYKISPATKRLFIWTHYFEPDLSLWNTSLQPLLREGKWDYKNIISKNIGRHQYRLVKQSYGAAIGWSGFCGGTDTFSHWIYKQDLLNLLEWNGFGKIEVAFDTVDHPNGPSFCLYCEK